MDLVESLAQLLGKLAEPLQAASAGGANPAAAAALTESLDQTAAVGAVDTSSTSLATLAEVLRLAGEFSAGLTDLAGAVESGSGFDVAGEELVQELLGLLVARYLDQHAPAALEVAALLTLAPESGFGLRQLDLTPVPALIGDPTGTLLRAYAGTGAQLSELEADAIAVVFLGRVQTLLNRLGVQAAPLAYTDRISPPPDFPGAGRALWIPLATDATGQPLATDAGLLLSVRSAAAGGAGIAIGAVGAAGMTFDGQRWRGEVKVVASDWLVVSDQGVSSPTANATASIELSATTVHPPPVFQTSATGTRLTIDSLGLRLILLVDAAGWDVKIELTLNRLKVISSPGDGDGFLGTVLGGDAGGGNDLVVGWDYRKGLYLGSGSTLTTHLPLPKLGPVTPTGLDLSLSPGDGSLTSTATLGLALQLGPLGVTVDRFGARANLTFPRAGGNLGPLDAAVSVVLPRTIGLSLNTGPVSGGGFLTVDPDQGLYAGGLQLQIGPVSVTAIGLLSTKLPDGSRGWSLVILISVRFPPIQLGFSFALTGIGGLLAVNRTTAIDALEAGFAAGALDTILFPVDIVRNAPRIVSDLQKFFPPAPGQFVIGPTVEITWGAGGILTAQLGIFIEFPRPIRVILVGRVRLALPTPKAAVVDIQLDILGSLDFSAKRLAFDAVLRNSRIGPFTLTGQAAVRLTWGGQPTFLCAIGGFNPRFQPPAGFPALPRVTLSLSTSDNPRIRLSTYLALTSNTAQVGARLDLYAGVNVPVLGRFAVAAVLGFDALFQFDPFAFVVDIFASIALTWNDSPFLAIGLTMTLSGPRPWHAVGTATFSLFGRHELRFEITTGEQPALSQPQVVDVLALVLTALAAASSWQAVAAPGQRGLVTLRDRTGDAGGAGRIVVHPLGSLEVKQNVAPLGVRLTRLGTTALAQPITVDLPTVALAGGPAARPLLDWFARAQFVDMDDAAKLSQPSFEQLPAGVSVGTPGPTAPSADRWQHHDVDLDVVLVTPGTADVVRTSLTATRTAALSVDRLLASVPSAAVAQAGPLARGAAAYGAPAPGIAVVPPAYAVVSTATLTGSAATPGGAAVTYPSFSAADDARRASDATLLVVEASDLFATVVGGVGEVM